MSQSEVCAYLAQVAAYVKTLQDQLQCQPGGGGAGCVMPPAPDEQGILQAKSATDFICGWFTRWQGYDPITVVIDPTLEGQGIAGYNDPNTRTLALNSDDPNYLVAGILENWKVLAIEGMELVTRHTENDWATQNRQQFGDATGRTYIVSEKGHRQHYFDVGALPQAQE